MRDEELLRLLAGVPPSELNEIVESLPPGAVANVLALMGSATSVIGSPLGMARVLDEGYRERQHLEYVSDVLTKALDDVEEGRSRQIVISLPPRSGKSYLATQIVPSWILQRHPDWNIAITSHDSSLAAQWGRQVRRWVEGGKVPGVKVAADAGAVKEWETTAGGGVLSRSIRESFTGRGARCVSADALLESEHGTVTARDAYNNGIGWLLAYDHVTERAQWQRVEAAQRSQRSDMVEVVTQGGRILRCTSDHPVYTGRGYVPAASLRPGETLVALPNSDRVPPVRAARGEGRSGHTQSDATTDERGVLLSGMRGAWPGGHSAAQVVPLRATREEEREVLLGCLPGGGSETETGQALSMRGTVSSAFFSRAILFPGMRERSPFETDARGKQFELQDGAGVFAVVQVDASPDPGKRQPVLRGMPASAGRDLSTPGPASVAVGAERASHRRGRDQQRPRESSDAVPGLPYGAPQVEGDTVAVVRELRGGSVDVYDFQVADTSNFFADGILTHNCLIIDDPHKDFVDAHSEVARGQVWDWWRSVAQTRLEPPSLVLVVMTRWHEDDLVGRLLSSEFDGDPGDWEVVEVPALAVEDDMLGREPGEPLLSPLFDEEPDGAVERWEAVQRSVGRYVWSALYQQSPAPSQGSIFDMETMRFWTTDPGLVSDDVRLVDLDEFARNGQWVDSWDFAFKGEKTSDWVVGQRWVKQGANRFLVAQQRGKWNFPESVAAMKRWATGRSGEGDPFGAVVHQRLVEDAANGPAIISTLRDEVAGIKAVKARVSKEARARAVTPDFEGQNVYLPHPREPGFEWVHELLSELREFPHGKNDDQVDALTQALLGLRSPGGGSISVPGRVVPRVERGPIRGGGSRRRIRG